MNILVTGASGFIGSAVCRELLRKNHRITGLTATGREAYLQKLKDHPRLSLYKGDLTRKDTLKNLFRQHFDALIHLAGVTPLATRDKEKFFGVNYQGTKNIVDLAWGKNVEKMLYLSTTSVHKKRDYGKSKLDAEQYCKKIAHLIILRSPGVYGHYKNAKALKLFIKGKLIPRALNFKDTTPDFIGVDELAHTVADLIDTLGRVRYKIIELPAKEKASFVHVCRSSIDLINAILHGW